MDKVVHFEIPGDDMDRLKGFYTDVFGWELTEYPEMDYVMVTTVPTGYDRMPSVSGAINGGMKKRDVAGEQPVIVIDVQSIDGTIGKVEAAGGKVVMPKAMVGDMGWYARVKDTEGNIIGVWETVPKKA